MRTRPRQHKRKLKSGKVIIINKGIEPKKKRAMAYKGFTVAMENKLQKVFDKNPRLKKKRDYLVRDIVLSDASSGAAFVKTAGFKDGDEHDVYISPSGTKVSYPDLVTSMEHEITHQAQKSRIGKDKFSKMSKKSRADIVDSHWLPDVMEQAVVVISPEEYRAYRFSDPEDKFPIQILNAASRNTRRVFRDRLNEFDDAMKKGKPISSGEKVWVPSRIEKIRGDYDEED